MTYSKLCLWDSLFHQLLVHIIYIHLYKALTNHRRCPNYICRLCGFCVLCWCRCMELLEYLWKCYSCWTPKSKLMEVEMLKLLHPSLKSEILSFLRWWPSDFLIIRKCLCYINVSLNGSNSLLLVAGQLCDQFKCKLGSIWARTFTTDWSGWCNQRPETFIVIILQYYCKLSTKETSSLPSFCSVLYLFLHYWCYISYGLQLRYLYSCSTCVTVVNIYVSSPVE